MDEAADQGVAIQIEIPPEHEGGAYADAVVVWCSRYGFTLDFVAPVQPGPEPGDGHGPAVIRQRVGARVRIPPAVIFPLMRALNEQLERFEQQFGQIQPQGGGDAPDR